MIVIDVKSPEWLPEAPKMELKAGYIANSEHAQRLYTPHGVSRDYKMPVRPQAVQTMTIFGVVTVAGAGVAAVVSMMDPLVAAVTGAALAAFGFCYYKDSIEYSTDAEKLWLLRKWNQPRQYQAITELFHHISPPSDPIKVKLVCPGNSNNNIVNPRQFWSGWYDANSNTIKIANDVPVDLLHDALIFLWAAATQRQRLKALEQNNGKPQDELDEACDHITEQIAKVAEKLETGFFRCHGYNDTVDITAQSDYGRYFSFGATCGKSNLLTFKTTLWPVPTKGRSINIPRKFSV